MSDPVNVDRRQLVQMLFGFYPVQVMHTMAVLDVPEHIAKANLTVADLAESTDTDESALRRLMRAAAGLKLVEHLPDGTLRLTPRGQLLHRDSPRSIRSLVLLWGGDAGWRSWGELAFSVRTGKPAYDELVGSTLFEHLDESPDERAVFNQAMAESSRVAAAGVLAVCALNDVPDVTDVGGGSGSLISSVLAANPSMRGVLFDRPTSVREAEELLRDHGLDSRCSVVGGDFFESVPAGASAYLLKSVLHDWNDAQCLKILANCRAALASGVPLFVIEPVVPEDDESLTQSSMTLLSDLNMLVCTGGMERTEADYRRLLDQAGLELEAVLPCPPPSNLSVLRASLA